MHSFRRVALLLAMGLPTMLSISAQSSSGNPPAQGQAQQPAADNNQLSVQARIKMRREQRRATAIHDAYDHRYDALAGTSYLRFQPGPSLQRTTFYAWNVDLTRYKSERLGYTLDARGYFGNAFTGITSVESQGAFTRFRISQYDVMAGPTYRFYLQPKFDIAGRVMAGVALGNFSGDTNHVPPPTLGLYPDGTTYAANAAIVGEYNITPAVVLRLAPEYHFTGFGSSLQASRGFSIGFVYRFGKQQ